MASTELNISDLWNKQYSCYGSFRTANWIGNTPSDYFSQIYMQNPKPDLNPLNKSVDGLTKVKTGVEGLTKVMWGERTLYMLETEEMSAEFVQKTIDKLMKIGANGAKKFVDKAKPNKIDYLALNKEMSGR